MKQTYLMPMARNTETAQTLQVQDFTGYRYTLADRTSANLVAERLALQMTERTGTLWRPLLRPYTLSR